MSIEETITSISVGIHSLESEWPRVLSPLLGRDRHEVSDGRGPTGDDILPV